MFDLISVAHGMFKVHFNNDNLNYVCFKNMQKHIFYTMKFYNGANI